MYLSFKSVCWVRFLSFDLFYLTVFWQADSPTVDHQIYATLMDACFIDA